MGKEEGGIRSQGSRGRQRLKTEMEGLEADSGTIDLWPYFSQESSHALLNARATSAFGSCPCPWHPSVVHRGATRMAHQEASEKRSRELLPQRRLKAEDQGTPCRGPALRQHQIHSWRRDWRNCLCGEMFRSAWRWGARVQWGYEPLYQRTEKHSSRD